MAGGFSLDTVLTHFLRSYKEPFTAKELSMMLSSTGFKISVKDIQEFLDTDGRVFPLEKKLYITRAGAFSGMFFSFVPTQQELEQGAFVPGDRLLPFVDFEVLSSSLFFEFNGNILSKKIIETDCNTARNLFTLFGDEYASQYIASDPVNADMNLAGNNFDLPSKVKLTAVDISEIIQATGFKKGDRFLCRVTNWDDGIVEIFPVLVHKMNPFEANAARIERFKWCESLEKALLSSFDRMGPCASMEEQLANVFYENRRTLCQQDCGSIEEFLNCTDKVAMELFGVETRLWRRGENVPAVGVWNKNTLNTSIDAGVPVFDLPDYVIDCYIKDHLFAKNEDLSDVVNKLIPEAMEVTPAEKEFFTLQINGRNAILRQKYNWFADFRVGSIRHTALELYSEVGSLVYDIDCAGSGLEQFPQQELVTLSQLYTHISRILELFASGNECEETEAAAIKLSLEGMKYNFDDIRTRLRAAVDRYRAGQFKII